MTDCNDAVHSLYHFLDGELTPEEAKIVEMKLALGDSLRRHRIRRGWTQLELAKRLRSSQSRVAKLETGALGVSLDLLFRALFHCPISVAFANACRLSRSAIVAIVIFLTPIVLLAPMFVRQSRDVIVIKVIARANR